MTKYYGFIVTFCVLAAVVSLFPPFYWGVDLLEKEDDSAAQRYFYAQYFPGIRDTLPIKEYGFLFGDVKKQIQRGWGWDDKQKKSIPTYVTIQRRVIVPEMILEYLLALIVASLMHVAIFSKPTRLDTIKRFLGSARR